MIKKTVKWIAALGAISALGAGFSFGAECGVPMHSEPCGFLPCSNPEPFQGPAMFAAKGCETRKITIGGNITTQYQYVDVNDEIRTSSVAIAGAQRTTVDRPDPEPYSNFLMAHIRLSVLAELGEGWSGYMNLDFAGQMRTIYRTFTPDNGAYIDRFCECRDQRSMYVDQAWIQKVWLDATFRVGHQKVNWVAENNTPEPYLKTIERSVATNFFINLGKRANAGDAGSWSVTALPNGDNFFYVGEGLGDRHTGVFVAGQVEAFHYSGAITSGYQGLCMHSDERNSSLNFYASLAYEFGIDEVDFLIGVNGGYSDKGTNVTRSKNLNVYGVNPYLFANWKCFSFMGEFLYGHVDEGNLTYTNNKREDSDPWGFNAIGSYMLNDCWELVGRFSYVNSDKMGMTIGQTFGCAPNDGTITVGANSVNPRISSDTIFEKVYAGYIGVNWYLMNGAIKISAGLEQAKYKNRFSGSVGTDGTYDHGVTLVTGKSSDGTSISNNKGAKINAARGQIQFLF